MIEARTTPPRNAPCPCGSGKRYKLCHGVPAKAGLLTDDQAATLVDEALRATAENRLVDAMRLLDRVLDARPGDVVAEHNRAIVLMQRGEAAAAIPALERTVAARPDDPGYHDNLGLAYAHADRFDDAIAAHRRALALDERRPGTWSNLGNALRDAARHDEAEASFERALAIDPSYAEARWHLATARLARNDPTAWEDFEARWSMLGVDGEPGLRGVPRYRGEDPAGCTIVVDDEQGYGDTLQSVRHTRALADRGARVIVRSQRTPLATLLATARGVDHVVGSDTIPTCDAWIPMMSLPGLLGIPPLGDHASVPYLHADPARVSAVRERLMRTPARLRVGLAWAGNPLQQNDRRRSAPLAALAPLLAREGVAWYSLQRVDGEDQIAAVPAARAMHLLPDRLDFDGKAALVTALDLVVSVCTSSAHLAGALGRPLWLMLAHVCDWRWGYEGTTTAWYPTARVFRQPAPGDWASVVSSVGAALDARLGA